MTDEPRASGDSPEAPAHKAFAAQRNRIKVLERENEDLQSQRDEKEFDGDPKTVGLTRQIRSLQVQVDQLMVGDIDEGQLEIAMAENPWLQTIPNKMDRVQAAKKIIAVDQQAGINAGNPSEGSGRSKKEAAAQAHLTGGGPPATSAGSASDEEREFSEYEKKMGKAKNQAERDKLAKSWADKHGEQRL